MRIAGLVKLSFLDYPGALAAVVFTPGCNMDCHYCHNPRLLRPDAETELVDEDGFFAFLQTRVNKLDGVVVSGGEPTLQPDLEGFVRRVKQAGFLVKLDTNGTRPDVLQNLLDERLLDFVAMDLKAPADRYSEICGVQVDTDAVLRSVGILSASDVEHEFRTTLSPLLTESDMVRMCEGLQGAGRWVIQQYRPEHHHVTVNRPIGLPPHSDATLRKAQEVALSMSVPCTLRGLAN